MKKSVKKTMIVCLCVCLAALLGAAGACGTGGEPPAEFCEHVWQEGTVTKEPTCDENGEKTFACTQCGETGTEAIPATGHKFPAAGTVTAQPDCITEGVTSFKCSVCGKTIEEPIPVAGHSYDDGAVTTPPACFDTGVTTFTCTVCGDTYTEAIDPVGHGDYNADGNCDECGEFIGEKEISADAVTLVDGPWTNPDGISWWSYGLEKSPSQETGIIVSTDEKVRTEGKKVVKVDFGAGSKCKPDDPSGAYIVHLGVSDLQKKANYTLEFYAWASDDFTGNLNKMLNNDNFGAGNSIGSVAYQPVYGPEELAGKGWVKVTATFIANPSLTYENRCGYRLAFDVGLSGWQGVLYLADFKLTLTDYLRAQQGLPPLDEPTRPVNTTPVLDSLPAGHVALPDEIPEGAVWTPGPLYSGEALFSVDPAVEYAKGAGSLLINLNKALTTGKESCVFLPFGGLTAGKRYELTFWAQGSETYNGALNRIFANPNYTHLVDGTETVTMTEMIAGVAPLLAAGEMEAADWRKMSVVFTADPKDGLCSLRLQLTQQEGWKGQLWLSCFTVADAPVIVPDGPQVTDPVEAALSADHVPLPADIPAGGVWESGPLYAGDAVFSIDGAVEYAAGARSVAIDFNAAAAGTESALILPFAGLTAGARYTLTFWVQGSVNFNGALSDVFENPNYTHVVDGTEVRTMLDVTKDLGSVCTAGGLLDAGWQRVSLTFTANPKDGKCSLRVQFRKAEGWTGMLWLSYFEVAAAAA